MSSALPALAGHRQVRQRFARALATGALPQSILLHGPAGVGKERLGLWLAQLLVCERPGDEPCGECAHCGHLLRLQHPDVHWFFPLPRPDSSSQEKLRERLEEERAAELQRWRENPFHQPRFEKAAAHYVAAIRTLQQLASVRPSLGKRKVFVIGDAELMVPQEASPEAANAFLKLLEEPPAETTLILTSSQPGALLPTIRSRVLSVRVGTVPAEELTALLESGQLAEGGAARRIAERARGSARRAIQLAGASANAEAAEPERKVAREMLLAALSDGAVARLALASDRRPAGARAELLGELEALAEWLRDLLAVASGSPEEVIDPDALPILTRMVEQRAIHPRGVMRALDRIDTVRDLAMNNVNPQLIVATLLADIQADLRGREIDGAA